MTHFRYVASALAVAALVAGTSAGAQTPNQNQLQNLKQEVKQDLTKLRADRAAEQALRPAHPESQRQEVMDTARELKRRMDVKRAQVEVLEKQAEGERDPLKRRDLERQIGTHHRELAGMQTEYGNALLYNIKPNLNDFRM
jgi:hypothetical protein